MNKIINNVVGINTMRVIQSRTLNELADYLTPSFGPLGSNTCIKKENALSRYTKDGHTIIGAIHYNGIIEQSIKDDIESITRHIVKTVGDGTTSAVLLSADIFEGIKEMIREMENDGCTVSGAEVIRAMEAAVNDIKNHIKSYSEDLTPDLVYDIAMISTNGNVFISNTLKDIYAEFGNTVYIDVTPGLSEDTVIKSYNGMTLNTGYCDSCYVTNRKNNTSEVDNPEVYFFEHPIDTRELGVYFDAIVSRNITHPVNTGDYSKLIPTVIFAPTISQDVSSIMDSLTANMAAMPAENKLPICIITAYHETAQLNDLAMMCGAKMIRKYIDSNTFKMDVEAGRAPTPDTISNWAGRCDRVVAYSDKTVFIRPHAMFNEDGSYSNIYNSLIAFLETEIENNYDTGDSLNEIGTLKRRLNSLKSNMVELFVGGITQADRDSLRDLVEDAVLNIRSAAKNGVGYGANIAAAVASDNLAVAIPCIEDSDNAVMQHSITKNIAKTYSNIVEDAVLNIRSTIKNGAGCGANIDAAATSDNLAAAILWDSDNAVMQHSITKTIAKAYRNLVDTLYNGTGIDYVKLSNRFNEDQSIFNIRTGKWDHSVRSSIMSDITILDTVSRIIGIMVTCNQFIVPTAMHNIYVK